MVKMTADKGKEKMRYQRIKAFTLIEMAIVLVIIGLVVGGVLVGKDLIKAAEQRKHINQVQEFNSATLTFRLKYDCLPGDCKNASSFGLTGANGITASQINGNGDGTVCAVSTHQVAIPYARVSLPPSFSAQECRNYWRHLSEAGFLAWRPPDPGEGGDCNSHINAGYETPPSALGQSKGAEGSVTSCGGWLISDPGSMNRGSNPYPNPRYVFLNLNTFDNMNTIPDESYFSLYTADAYAVDVKLDDGMPNSGTVHAVGASQDVTTNPRGLTGVPTGAVGSASCIATTTPPSYNISYGGYVCNLAIGAAF